MSDAACWKSAVLGKRFGGFVALADDRPRGAAGRARRADRSERLRQEHAGELHLRHAAQRDRQRALRRPEAGRAESAHERTRLGLARSFQLPRPFATLTLAENLRVPILYAVHVRAATRWSTSKAAAPSCCGMVGLADKAHQLPRDLTQIEMRKLELARAMASEPRLLIADEAMAGLSHGEVDDILALLLRLNEAGRHHHHDRAHHARGAGISRSGWWCWWPAARSPTAIRRRWCASPTWCGPILAS